MAAYLNITNLTTANGVIIEVRLCRNLTLILKVNLYDYADSDPLEQISLNSFKYVSEHLMPAPQSQILLDHAKPHVSPPPQQSSLKMQPDVKHQKEIRKLDTLCGAIRNTKKRQICWFYIKRLWIQSFGFNDPQDFGHRETTLKNYANAYRPQNVILTQKNGAQIGLVCGAFRICIFYHAEIVIIEKWTKTERSRALLLFRLKRFLINLNSTRIYQASDSLPMFLIGVMYSCDIKP